MLGLGNIKSTLNKTLTGTQAVNGLGVVAGLGKPYIKLEFDDNEALVDFQKRIQPSGEAEPVEFRNGEFYPLEGYGDKYVISDLREKSRKKLTELKKIDSAKIKISDFQEDTSDTTIENKQEGKKEVKRKQTTGGVSIIKNGDKIEVSSPYSYNFVKKAKNYGGKWNGDAWVFDKSEIDEIRNILKDIYGSDGTLQNSVTLLVKDFSDSEYGGGVSVFDIPIARAWGRDSGAKLADNIVLVDGEINSGGSMKNWKTIVDDATFKIKNVPAGILQREDVKKAIEDGWLEVFEDYEDLTTNGLGAPGVSGLTVNDQPAAVFNCPEAFLQTKGFTPTYTRLEDYSALIEPATGEKRLVGYGFEAATLDQLKNACKNYKQVAKLASHLKGDTELQSAFNVWHWLHTNIKYNYDAPGQEEIRTPARTFADRESGVDCDCLAVFAACLLGAMGYKPRFEIVAFGNSPKFSHIYVNLNGAAVDRVLPVFLARPSGITKTKIMEIPVFELSGGGAMEAAATLNGIYESALAKVQAHEATAEDSADLRKSQILMTLQNSDPQAYRLAAILMPHVVAIDDDGAWYFADSNVAEIADKADKKLYGLKISEVNDNIFENFFNDILNEFKNISVKVERGDSTTILTISFTNPANDAVTVTGDYIKKEFLALNPNFLTMRESLKNLLAVNYLGLASKYAVGLMTEQEAVAAGYSVETWKKAVKAFETLTRFWILIGGKAENIADIILNGSAKEPLTDKNINYEANIVATSDTDAILSGCKKRGLSGLNGLGETPTVASDIENLGEEGLEKILDWCSEIETEEEKAAENSDNNPVNVLAQNATPAAASSAPATTDEKKKSLIWWLLGGAALGGGIAAATGGKKNKRRK